MKLRVLIVDDEPLARSRLRRLLRLDPDVTVLAECPDGPAAVAAIRAHHPDVVFLDVQMPGMGGFNVLAEVGPQYMPVVVFVTAHDQFALQAFEAQALDYLLKPFGEERVRTAVERARRFLVGGEHTAQRQQLAALLRSTSAARGSVSLLVKRGGRILVLNASEIDWVEAYGDYVRLYVSGTSHVLRSTLADMERRLAPEGFARIHRSRLVNWERVREFAVEGEQTSEVVLKSGQRLNASQSCLKALLQRLESAH